MRAGAKEQDSRACHGMEPELPLATNRGLLRWVRYDKSEAWTTPTLVEICVGLEINGYLPAEF